MEKLERLRANLELVQVDGMLITNPYNRRYMTNFTGSTGVVLLSQHEAKFITDFRYTEQATEQIKGYEIVLQKGTYAQDVSELAAKMGIKRLAFEKDHLTYSTFKDYEEKFSGELVPVNGVVEKLRLIKTPAEIKILKVAADIADAAFKYILDVIRPGISEREVSNELEFFMRRAGATSSSFDTIVASGKRSAMPHGVATDKVIESGDFVTMDYGAYYNGYVSDFTRTVAVGEPSDELKKIYEIVLDAQLHSIKSIKPGMTGKEADALARDVISAKGYGEYFGHSLGHGIGLEIHEGPAMSFKSDTVLESGMAVTIEPGIYLPGVGGVRIEDAVMLTDDSSEVLTHSTKELIIL